MTDAAPVWTPAIGTWVKRFDSLVGRVVKGPDVHHPRDDDRWYTVFAYPDWKNHNRFVADWHVSTAIEPLGVIDALAGARSFERAKAEFERLVGESGLLVLSTDLQVMPRIVPDERVNTTTLGEVRLYTACCDDLMDHERSHPAEWHARHVFGHWLCDLHNEFRTGSSQLQRGGPHSNLADLVADYIARRVIQRAKPPGAPR